MPDDGPPPVRRMTPKEMLGDIDKVGPEVWKNPGLGATPGGAFSEQMPGMEMPGDNHRPIGPEVFTPHAEDPREQVHANGQQVPPKPSWTPPHLQTEGLGQEEGSPAQPVMPAPPQSLWNPKWTPVILVGAALAFAWWYNKNN